MAPEQGLLRIVVLNGGEADRRAVHTCLKAAGIEAEVSEPELERALERERFELIAREREARGQAETASRARDEFLATLSHELLTPINAILGWARLIAGGSLKPSTVERAVAIIERNARMEAQLIDDLLDISRLTSGTLQLDVRTTELSPLLLSAVESIRTAAQAKGIHIEVDVSAAPARIRCDPARLHQIVWNFLSNAVKFTPQGGRIWVAAERTDASVSIRVQDTGTGIKPEFLPFVFERFRQQDGATTRFQGGVGAGLAIARYLAELHGGGVSAASAGHGRGSTFTVSLPLAAD